LNAANTEQPERSVPRSIKLLAQEGFPRGHGTQSVEVGRSSGGIVGVPGDLSDADSRHPPWTGCEYGLPLPPLSQDNVEMQKVFIDAAKRAGVRHIVKLSAIGSVPESRSCCCVGMPRPVDLKASGLAYTILAAEWLYAEILGSAGTIAGQGVIYAPADDAHISHIDVRDSPQR